MSLISIEIHKHFIITGNSVSFSLGELKVPHTKINVQTSDQQKIKTFAELQKGDWFFYRGEYWIKLGMTFIDSGINADQANAINTSGSHNKFPEKEAVRPIKQVSINIEWN